MYLETRLMKTLTRTTCVTVIPMLLVACVSAADWQPAQGPLSTRWTKDVSPDNAWREYPRPQMVRPDWVNLNGLWQYAIAEKDA